MSSQPALPSDAPCSALLSAQLIPRNQPLIILQLSSSSTPPRITSSSRTYATYRYPDSPPPYREPSATYLANHHGLKPPALNQSRRSGHFYVREYDPSHPPPDRSDQRTSEPTHHHHRASPLVTLYNEPGYPPPPGVESIPSFMVHQGRAGHATGIMIEGGRVLTKSEEKRLLKEKREKEKMLENRAKNEAESQAEG